MPGSREKAPFETISTRFGRSLASVQTTCAFNRESFSKDAQRDFVTGRVVVQ
jgi:hypothetical protein